MFQATTQLGRKNRKEREKKEEKGEREERQSKHPKRTLIVAIVVRKDLQRS